MSNVVTRIAPSPTGDMHIGTARTALFNWLYARGRNGKFLLRIEDTDKNRSTDAAQDAILDGMKWLGLDFDGEPIAAVIFTDISKDGMMSGPNVNATLELAKQTDIPVIASGGVSSLEHLKQLSNENILFGAICGRALYESAFTYSEALEVIGR